MVTAGAAAVFQLPQVAVVKAVYLLSEELLVVNVEVITQSLVEWYGNPYNSGSNPYDVR